MKGFISLLILVLALISVPPSLTTDLKALFKSSYWMRPQSAFFRDKLFPPLTSEPAKEHGDNEGGASDFLNKDPFDIGFGRTTPFFGSRLLSPSPSTMFPLKPTAPTKVHGSKPHWPPKNSLWPEIPKNTPVTLKLSKLPVMDLTQHSRESNGPPKGSTQPHWKSHQNNNRDSVWPNSGPSITFGQPPSGPSGNSQNSWPPHHLGGPNWQSDSPNGQIPNGPNWQQNPGNAPTYPLWPPEGPTGPPSNTNWISNSNNNGPPQHKYTGPPGDPFRPPEFSPAGQEWSPQNNRDFSGPPLGAENRPPSPNWLEEKLKNPANSEWSGPQNSQGPPKDSSWLSKNVNLPTNPNWTSNDMNFPPYESNGPSEEFSGNQFSSYPPQKTKLPKPPNVQHPPKTNPIELKPKQPADPLKEQNITKPSKNYSRKPKPQPKEPPKDLKDPKDNEIPQIEIPELPKPPPSKLEPEHPPDKNPHYHHKRLPPPPTIDHPYHHLEPTHPEEGNDEKMHPHNNGNDHNDFMQPKEPNDHHNHHHEIEIDPPTHDEDPDKPFIDTGTPPVDYKKPSKGHPSKGSHKGSSGHHKGSSNDKSPPRDSQWPPQRIIEPIPKPTKRPSSCFPYSGGGVRKQKGWWSYKPPPSYQCPHPKGPPLHSSGGGAGDNGWAILQIDRILEDQEDEKPPPGFLKYPLHQRKTPKYLKAIRSYLNKKGESSWLFQSRKWH